MNECKYLRKLFEIMEFRNDEEEDETDYEVREEEQ
jgi:hypothetical protein